MAWNDLTNPEAWKLALANLLRKGEDVGTYISEAPEKAGKAIVEAGQRQSALMDKAFDPTGKTLIRDPKVANQAAMNLLEGPLGFMPAGITAWHGSPHTFEKFDMSKVGTGEGAQAYGHGMYFAESPNVAKSYIVNTELQKTPEGMARSYAEKYPSTKEAIEGAKNKLERLINNGDIAEAKIQEQVVKSLESGNLGGNLYKVDIPDEHIPMMLDWDKPLSQQSKKVQEAFKNAPFETAGNDWLGRDLLDIAESYAGTTGRSADKSIKGGAELLNSLGIKGIKYLDQSSRGAGKGTSNFVVFDPTDVKILERNNQPVSRKELIEEQVKKLK